MATICLLLRRTLERLVILLSILQVAILAAKNLMVKNFFSGECSQQFLTILSFLRGHSSREEAGEIIKSASTL